MVALLLMVGVMNDAQIKQAIVAAPAPIRAFIERRQGCNHWSGEEPYDRERAEQIEAARRTLRCRRIDTDEKDLRRRYARQPAVLDLLRRTADREAED